MALAVVLAALELASPGGFVVIFFALAAALVGLRAETDLPGVQQGIGRNGQQVLPGPLLRALERAAQQAHATDAAADGSRGVDSPQRIGPALRWWLETDIRRIAAAQSLEHHPGSPR